NFEKKYNRFTMENSRQLQCNSLRRREKSRRRKNNGKQWKKQCAEQWKQSGIGARSDASPGQIDTAQKQSPAAERRRAHTSRTRISTIAHPSAKTHKKALPLFLQAYQKRGPRGRRPHLIRRAAAASPARRSASSARSPASPRAWRARPAR